MRVVYEQRRPVVRCERSALVARLLLAMWMIGRRLVDALIRAPARTDDTEALDAPFAGKVGFGMPNTLN